VIADAVRLGAPHAWTTATVARIVQQRTGSRYLRRVWELLMETPDTPESLVSAMATSAAAQGDITNARAAFGRLIEGKVVTPVVWNNYAWTLLQEPDPDPQAALEAVGRALEAAPNDFRFRETRGQVMIALGRWSDAISDLEYALNGLPDATEVHRSLAAAYEATSQHHLADLHRRQAGL
jgi:predicted Zn-dependent protease